MPPRVPQFNWVDLGLPSGTLWLDRPLGAKNIGDPGLMYQWGSLVGYRNATDKPFSMDVYSEKGLNTISASLTEEQDAASSYYGGIARMPTAIQLEELIQYTTVTYSERRYEIKSRINGKSINIYGRGYFVNSGVDNTIALELWSRTYVSQQFAKHLIINGFQAPSVGEDQRYHGLLILPVHS